MSFLSIRNRTCCWGSSFEQDRKPNPGPHEAHSLVGKTVGTWAIGMHDILEQVTSKLEHILKISGKKEI